MVKPVRNAERRKMRGKALVRRVQPVLLAAVMVLSLTGAAVLLKKKLLVK